MIKEAFGIGADIEEAKESALASLNARPDDDVQFEIIDMPKAKVLGIFGGKTAKVRAFVELPEAKPAKRKNDKPANKQKKAEKSDNKQKKTEAKQSRPSSDYADAVPFAEIDKSSPAGKAAAYISNIMEKLGCSDIDIKVAVKENGAMIILSGNGLGVVIGRRGETLDSLQYLTSLAANNGGGYYKISLNVGNYREKREQTLTALAKRVSAQVIQTSKSRSLEPMNPYERRIIHTAVQEIEGITSGSVGEGSSRRVVISPVGGSAPAKKAAAPVAREPKKDAANAPLYGKIN